MELPPSLYVPAGDGVYDSTALTIGPWSDAAQHAGPPAALLTREVERAGGIAGGQPVRLAFDILGPVPVGPVRVRSRVLRAGRRVELVEATLSDAAPNDAASSDAASTDAAERPAMRVTAWRMRAADGPAGPEQPPAHGPGDGWVDAMDFFPTVVSYRDALEWRVVEGGGFTSSGPGSAWTRARCALVEGEELTPLEHLLLMADASSGLSSVLDWGSASFANVDLVVALRRPPSGAWLCTEAVTHLGGSGTAQCFAALYDADGLIGRSTQSLLVEPR